MAINSIFKFFILSLVITSCISTSQHQSVVENTKRLEALIEKERKENDQLNAQRSALESQIVNLVGQVAALNAEKQILTETIATQNNKHKEESKKNELELKRLDATIQQQKDNNEKVVDALGDKLNDLAEDKQELINEKYKARKNANTSRRRRRR